jgi:hypothetical protein
VAQVAGDSPDGFGYEPQNHSKASAFQLGESHYNLSCVCERCAVHKRRYRRLK